MFPPASFWIGTFSALAMGSLSAQLRIVDYNTGGGPRTGLEVVLAAIGAEAVNGVSKTPDVFSLQEQGTGDTEAIVNLLNGIYGAGTYARSAVVGTTTGAGTPGLIFNTQTVQLLATTTASTTGASGAARQTMRYELRPVGYDEAADFYLYSSHYKASSSASDVARRNVEAQQVRANADALGEGAHVLYTGDFNIYRSSEAMWGTLTAAGAGQAFDPINRVGAWSNTSSFKDVHTQSPVTTARYGGQITGGMDDRFDFQLTSGEFLDGEGLSYLAGSYHAFGNTGTHAFNGEITSGSAAALQARLPGYTAQQATDVLTALAAASDHLPVVAQYQLPAKMQVGVGSTPSRVLVGADAQVNVTVTNAAAVVVANGADELDYVVTGTGAAEGSQIGSVLALASGDVVALSLATNTVGSMEGGVSVQSDSQAAANPNFSASFDYEVLDHARAIFADDPEVITLTLDFGEVAQFSEAIREAFSLANATSPLGASAGLDLDAILTAGGWTPFFTDLALFDALTAGDAVQFFVGLNTDIAGDFSYRYELAFSDEDILGAANVGSLTLDVIGRITPVPEPATMVIFALGLGMTSGGWLYRRVRGKT